ncbi:MAG: coiled-coil domain-containing protein, partial [Candidatus Woesearchaeota archaeon]
LHMKVEVKNETIKLSNILKELKEKLNLKWYNDYFINTLESYEKNIKINIEELNDVIINLKQELEKEIKLLNSKVEEVNELKLEKEREIKSMKTELNVLKDKIKDLEDEIEDVNEKIHYEDLFEDAFDGKPKPAYSGISSSGHGKALK